MIFDFSITELIGYILSIIICIGIWRVYAGSKNNMLNVGGFSMINVILTIDLIIWMVVAVVVALAGIGVLRTEAYVVGIIILVIAFLIGFYWWALRKTTHCAYHVANGTGKKLYSSHWPVIVLGISSVWKVLMFFSKLAMQMGANQATNSIMQYSNELSSAIASFFSDYGLSYQYGYDEASSALQMITDPVNNWIQSTFGLKESVLGMLFALLIPACAAVLLANISSGKGEVRD